MPSWCFHKQSKSNMKKGLFLFVAAILLLSSCKTKNVIEYRDRDVVKYNTVYVHDTLVNNVHDSIYHTVFQKGDTVYDTKYIERTQWRDRIVERHDTCWRDSTRTEYKETTKEVTRIPNIFWCSMIFSILIIIFALLKVLRRIKVI